MKDKKLITLMLAGIALVFIMTGLAIACQAGRIGRYVHGAEVEGTVYGYEARYSRGSSAYHCYLFCRYTDETGQVYKTEFQYNLSNASKEYAESYGEKMLNKPIKLYFNGSGCISETEAKRYAPYVAVCVILFVAGTATACVPLTVNAVKRRRERRREPSEEDYLI